jgi:hypothetical protein
MKHNFIQAIISENLITWPPKNTLFGYKNGLLVIIFLLSNFFISTVYAQKYLDPGLGLSYDYKSNNFALRGNVGFHNVIFNRVGLYYTLEVGLQKDDGTKRYMRDIVGPIFKLTDFISLYGGVGFSTNGLLENNFDLYGLRKEVGIQFNIVKMNLTADFGISANYSTFNIGYKIPFGKKKGKQGELVSNEGIISIPGETIVADSLSSKKELSKETSDYNLSDTIHNKPSTNGSDTIIDLSRKDEKENILNTDDKNKSDGKENQNTVTITDLKDGYYAVDGVFGVKENAVNLVNSLRKEGGSNPNIGYHPQRDFYYIWYYHDQSFLKVKTYVDVKRNTGKHPEMWILKVNP